MNTFEIRYTVYAAVVLQLIWFLLPQVEYRWMSDDAIVIMSYAGFESSYDISAVFSWLNLAITVVILLGVLYFPYWWRYLLAIYFVVNILVVVPFAGMVVETGLSMAIRDLLNIAIGLTIAFCFMKPTTDFGAQPSSIDNIDKGHA
jgi:hypothetical protein